MIRYLFFIFILLFSFNCYSQTEILGKVCFLKEGVPGVQVKIKGEKNETYTDIEGNFHLIISNKKTKILSISNPGFPSIELYNVIIPEKSQLIQLGSIDLFFNKTIESKAYNNLTSESKKDYYELTCYGNSLGYVSKNQIEERDLIIINHHDNLLNYKVYYDSVTNTVMIDYVKLKEILQVNK